jgi:GAF domain-containing protein
MRAVDVELVTIHEISQALRSAPELGKTLGTVVDVLSKRLGVSHAMVTFVTPSGDLELVASAGVGDQGFAPTAAHDAAAMPPMSLVGVPIKASGRDLGILSCTRRPGAQSGSFQQDVRLLSIVAHLIGEAAKRHEPAVPAEGQDPTPQSARFH